MPCSGTFAGTPSCIHLTHTILTLLFECAISLGVSRTSLGNVCDWYNTDVAPGDASAPGKLRFWSTWFSPARRVLKAWVFMRSKWMQNSRSSSVCGFYGNLQVRKMCTILRRKHSPPTLPTSSFNTSHFPTITTRKLL